MSHIVPPHLDLLHNASHRKMDTLRGIGSDGRKKILASYLQGAKNASQEPKIPDPKLFDSLGYTGSAAPESDLPTLSECAVHLELLEVFYKLRQDIIKCEKLDASFGVTMNKKTVYRKGYYDPPRRRYTTYPVQLADETWPTRRRQKWSYFLSIAVGRFKVWMIAANRSLKVPNNLEDQAPLSTEFNRPKLPFLPPLGTYLSGMKCGSTRNGPANSVSRCSDRLARLAAQSSLL